MPMFLMPADVQSQSNAERRPAVAVERRAQTCSRSRAQSADKLSQSNARTDENAVAVERARTTNSRPSHACATPSVPSHKFHAHAVNRPLRARPPSVPSNDFSCPRSRTRGQTDKHAPCTHLCPACLIAQLDTKSVTDTPRATCVHMPACPLAVQLAFPWALPMRTHVPPMPRQFSRPVCASVDIPMDQLP